MLSIFMNRNEFQPQTAYLSLSMRNSNSFTFECKIMLLKVIEMYYTRRVIFIYHFQSIGKCVDQFMV